MSDHFSSLVRSRRLELGLTQIELSRQMGVSKSVIAKMEQGLTRSILSTRIHFFTNPPLLFSREIVESWCSTNRECSIKGCSKPAEKRTVCGMHYRRWQRDGDLRGADRERPSYVDSICLIVGCGLKPHGQGLCDKHYMQFLRSR